MREWAEMYLLLEVAVKAGLAEVVVTRRGDRVPQGTGAEPALELAQSGLVL